MENRDYLELSFRSIQAFADDGKLDSKEFDELISIALRDGEIDANERRVLGNILDRVRPEEIDAELGRKIHDLQVLLTGSDD